MDTAQVEARSAPPTDRLVTAAEYAEHPEWGPCELIRGRIVTRPYALPIRGFLSAEISFAVGRFLESHRLGKLFVGQVGIVLERNPDTVRGPDVGFVRMEHLPPKGEEDGYFETPPDLCVEIVSPTDRWSEVEEKVDMFLAAGVTLVWVVDPKTRKAHVFRKGREVRVVDAKGSLDGEDVLPGFTLPLAEVFATIE